MGKEFTFFDYVDTNGVNTIKALLDGLDKTVKAHLNAWLQHLEATPPGQWKRPLVDTLTDECAGLFEVRVKKYRILGFHGPGQGSPTLALGIRKKSNKVPKRDCEEALSIKQIVEAQPAERRVKHDYTG